MAKCFGQYSRNVDEKGRIIVPPNFRENLGASIYLVKGKNNRLTVYAKDDWDEFFDKYENQDFDDDDAEKKLTLIARRVSDAKYDKQGRMKIPEKYLGYAGIKEEVEIVGTGRRFDIWNPASYEKFSDE